jgi:hypothetical protein
MEGGAISFYNNETFPPFQIKVLRRLTQRPQRFKLNVSTLQKNIIGSEAKSEQLKMN